MTRLFRPHLTSEVGLHTETPGLGQRFIAIAATTAAFAGLVMTAMGCLPLTAGAALLHARKPAGPQPTYPCEGCWLPLVREHLVVLPGCIDSCGVYLNGSAG